MFFSFPLRCTSLLSASRVLGLQCTQHIGHQFLDGWGHDALCYTHPTLIAEGWRHSPLLYTLPPRLSLPLHTVSSRAPENLGKMPWEESSWAWKSVPLTFSSGELWCLITQIFFNVLSLCIWGYMCTCGGQRTLTFSFELYVGSRDQLSFTYWVILPVLSSSS